MSDSSTTPGAQPDPEPGPQPLGAPETHPDLPLEVLEDDEDVPPRPEESVADAREDV
ncbi:hypothetical protein [Aquipuribacter sp. MA13-6]|uniref:hypothetical protein n=1 Tax=unclassified Aquipuribacter TaxID=2635084 RepID=UPI003EE95B40